MLCYDAATYPKQMTGKFMTALARSHAEGRDPRLWTADQFLDFYMTRPDGERWQLVDGLPMMMVPPTPIHQKLGKNLLYLLDRALERHRPELEAFYELGVRIPNVDDFNPQPDLLVIDAAALFDRYIETYYLVAEVISPSNTAEMIDRKLELYRSHPENLYCLTIDQDSVHVSLHTRETTWTRTDLRSLDDLLKLTAFGFEASLKDIYKGTPLGR
jgi:Uma2 family endonuclease